MSDKGKTKREEYLDFLVKECIKLREALVSPEKIGVILRGCLTKEDFKKALLMVYPVESKDCPVEIQIGFVKVLFLTGLSPELVIHDGVKTFCELFPENPLSMFLSFPSAIYLNSNIIKMFLNQLFGDDFNERVKGIIDSCGNYPDIIKIIGFEKDFKDDFAVICEALDFSLFSDLNKNDDYFKDNNNHRLEIYRELVMLICKKIKTEHFSGE